MPWDAITTECEPIPDEEPMEEPSPGGSTTPYYFCFSCEARWPFDGPNPRTSAEEWARCCAAPVILVTVDKP